MGRKKNFWKSKSLQNNLLKQGSSCRLTMSLLRLGLSTLRTRSLSALQPVTVEQRACYHEKVLDHYENPRNVGKLDAKKKNVASSSLATEWIKGKNVDQAGAIKNSDIAKELSLPPVKLHCSMLAEDAIKAALKDYKTKKEVASQQ